MKIKIKEKTLFARAAAYQLKCKTVAAVLGDTIHLWNISRDEFLRRESWVMHEVEHVRQYQRHGFFPFVVMYLWECARVGYYNNRFEKEARLVEEGAVNLSGIVFV